ncbi:MAG: DUF2807 domain-containing protein [Bacteroidales bacterium]|nr:DUF2807 domain-containing protein [Bacteroidales bacterium]
MKKGLIILWSVLLFWGINAQEKNYQGLSNFTKVGIAVPADVIVTQSSNQSVRIETIQSNLDKIEVAVKDKKLIIKSIRNNTHFSGKIKIYISMNKINELSLAGSGNITTQGKVTTDDLDLSVAGSGNISSKNLTAESVKVSIAGSGKINLSGDGIANSLKASIAGSGDVHAKDFKAQSVKTSISGSADCYVSAVEELKVSLSGSGNVYYLGNPLIDAHISGSGKVKSIN